ncbi:conserved hypothetical protein [Roseibium sp. TrichSKD4]|nr:conserved hypothetical protein [Roseibium sp. TrichSKD4]
MPIGISSEFKFHRFEEFDTDRGGELKPVASSDLIVKSPPEHFCENCFGEDLSGRKQKALEILESSLRRIDLSKRI